MGDSFRHCETPLHGINCAETITHFKMLRAEGKINDTVIENMLNWHHSGFNVYCGDAIWPNNEEGLENLARYITRCASACAAHPDII